MTSSWMNQWWMQQIFTETTFGLSLPNQQNIYKTPVPDVAAHPCGMESFSDPSQAPCMERKQQAVSCLCLLSVLSPWVASSSACAEKVKTGCLHFQAMPESQVRFDTSLNPKFYGRKPSHLAPFLSIKTKSIFALVSVPCLNLWIRSVLQKFKWGNSVPA